MKNVFAASALLALALVANAAGISEDERRFLADETHGVCVKNQTTNPVNRNMTAAQINEYCTCYSARVAYRVTDGILRAHERGDSSGLVLLGQNSSRECAAVLFPKWGY